ncbi:Telomere repeat-binding factor 2 [Raphanus sativus]|nr:Telomere repeat-binding factor 2 [Raphanus sativus]
MGMNNEFWKKAKLALKRALPPPKHDHDGNNNNTRALTIVPLANEEERTNPTSPRTHASKKSITSLDKIILEAITNLKKPRGSDRTSMFMDNFKTPPNMKRHVAVRLKHLSSRGPLPKIKHKYRFSTNSAATPQLCLEGNNKNGLPKPKENERRQQVQSRRRAEEAAKEADRAEAEAEAEAAQIYAKSAMKALNFRISSNQSYLVKHKEAIMGKIL